MVKKEKNVVTTITTFNRKELLKESVEALLEQSYKNLKIVIVDNASSDGTKDYIKDLVDSKKVYFIRSEKNLGASGGFNIGIRKAFELGCDYVWIMDDDTIVHKDSLENLVNSAKKLKDDFGFLGSKVLWKDGSLCKMNLQRNTVFKTNNDYESSLVEVTLSSFVSFFLKRATIEQMGLPMEVFFIWGDDWEYSRRISQKYKCYLVNDSVVTHKCSSNSGGNIAIDDVSRLNRYEYAFRNDGYFYKREGIKGYLYLILRQFYYLFKILFSKSKMKFKRIKIVFGCTFKGFFFNPPIEYVNENKGDVKK